MGTETIDAVDAPERVGETALKSSASAGTIATLLGGAALLSACGGGDAGGSAAPAPTPAPTPTPTPPAVTRIQASRFLAQSTMGATSAAIDDVVAKGYSGWLDTQFAQPRATSHWDWLVANGYAVTANMNGETGFDQTMWRQLIVEPDQLRQRVGMALLDILVVGISGINLSWRQFAMAAYVDVLLDNAFGNYRDLLGAVTKSAAMASFLTYLNNRKANTATGAIPDENYARESMQLFTIGLLQLNQDGTPKTAGGQPVETYTLTDVAQLARVYTGLTLDGTDNTTPDRMRRPLVMNAANHETGPSTVLGTPIDGAQGMASVDKALDVLFAQPNVPPFIAKQLIQRLVTSNPSAGYVTRVADAFANNGAGVRGDMKAVIRAILLDAEARSDASLSSSTAGKLREPVMRLTAWARAFGVNSPSNAWAIGDTSNQTNRLGQSKGRAPSVFNFYRPAYVPAGSAIATLGLVAPEFQITNEQSVIGYINYMQGLVANGTGDVKADYTGILAKAADSAALVEEVNVLLAAGQLSAATVTTIRNAVDSVGATATNGPINRVGIAILLTLASPEFITVK